MTQITLSNYRVEYSAPDYSKGHTFEPYCAILADAAEFDGREVRVFDVPDPDESQRAVAQFACDAMNQHETLFAALLELDKAILNGDLKWTRRRYSDSDAYHPANVKLCAARELLDACQRDTPMTTRNEHEGDHWQLCPACECGISATDRDAGYCTNCNRQLTTKEIRQWRQRQRSKQTPAKIIRLRSALNAAIASTIQSILSAPSSDSTTQSHESFIARHNSKWRMRSRS